MSFPLRPFRLATCCFLLSLVACVASQSSDATGDESSDQTSSGFRVAVQTPDPVTPGTATELAIKVTGPDGQVVKAFDEMHTQTMHVVGVSTDLQDFMHVHPTLAADGTLTVTTGTFQKAQPYNFFYEYDPKGPATEQTSRSTLLPIGAQAVAPKLAASASIFDGSQLATTTTGATPTRFELLPLDHSMIMAGTTTTFRAAIKTASGAPATDLTDWLGMPGHAIVLSEDGSTFIHAHAFPPGSGGMGHMPGMHMPGMHMPHGGHDTGSTPDAGVAEPGRLDIDVTIPKAGLYKIFIQVKRGEEVLTAPFVVNAQAM